MIKRESSVDEFVYWYLCREQRKGNPLCITIPRTPSDQLDLMLQHKELKDKLLLPWYETGHCQKDQIHRTSSISQIPAILRTTTHTH